MKRAALLLAFVPLSGTASAQGFDVLRQDITVDVSSSTVTSIEVVAELAADGPTTEIWMLVPALPIGSLTIDGVEATVTPHPQYPDQVSVVELPTERADGEAFQMVLRTAGTLGCSSRLQPGTLACVRTADQTILVPASPDSGWYLFNLLAFDPFLGSITVRAPDDFQLAAIEGDPEETRDLGGGVVEARFEIEKATETLGLYAGRAEKVEAPGVVGLFTGDHREKMQRSVDLAAEVLPLYQARFGATGIDRTRIISIPRGFPFGGLGLFGTVLFGDYVVGELDYLLEQGTAHELGHTWWGGLASSADSAAAGFFAEAFAEYSARWVLGRVQGPAARVAGNRMNAVWYMYRRPGDADVAPLDPNVRDSPVYVFATYHKASVALGTIESAMGEDAFTSALRRMIARGPGGTTTSSFIADLEDAGDTAAARDVHQWFETTGFPHLTVSAHAEDGAVVVDVGTAGDYTFGVPVRAFSPDGTFTDSRLEIAPGATSQAVPGAPILIQLDPDWTAVREIRPSPAGDVSFDGAVDGIDLIEVALRIGTSLPTERRVDRGYDPLYDLNEDRLVDALDLAAITSD